MGGGEYGWVGHYFGYVGMSGGGLTFSIKFEISSSKNCSKTKCLSSKVNKKYFTKNPYSYPYYKEKGNFKIFHHGIP